MRKMTFLPALLLVFTAACDPAGPGATGRVTISPVAGIQAGRTLEVRAFPDVGVPLETSLQDTLNQPWFRARSWRLAAIEFPFIYEIGGGLGYTEDRNWRIVAWIAETDAVDKPASGEWYGTRIFTLNECGIMFPGYCGTTTDVDIEVEQK